MKQLYAAKIKKKTIGANVHYQTRSYMLVLAPSLDLSLYCIFVFFLSLSTLFRSVISSSRRFVRRYMNATIAADVLSPHHISASWRMCPPPEHQPKPD